MNRRITRRRIEGAALAVGLAGVGFLLWGPFATPDVLPPALLAAIFLAVLAITAVLAVFLVERSQASDAVAAGEERLKLALEGAEDGIWDWDLRIHEIVVNERWSSMLGYEPGEIEPTWQGWIQLVHPSEAAGVKKALEAHLAGKIPIYQAEYRMRAHSGEWRWVLARGKVVERDENGRPLRMSGIHKDITERKRAREALVRSEALIRAILETAPDGVVTVNEDGMIESWNAAAERIFGYSSGEILGRSARLLMPPKDRQKPHDVLVRELETELPKLLGRTREMVGCRRDSTIFPLELSVGEVRLRDHRLYTGIVRDITARKEAEEDLKLYRALVENTSEGVLLIRAKDERIIYANPAFERMFEYAPGELIRSHVGAIYAADEKGTRDFLRKLVESLDQHGGWRGEVRALKKGGLLFWCRTRVSTFDHPKYERVWVSVHEDITDQMRAEEERYWLESQLRQAYKMESLGQLAGGVAHDFSNLLAVIGGHLKAAAQGAEDQIPLYQELRQAQRATARATALTQKLLAFSQRQVLRPADVVLNDVLEDAREMLETAASEDVEIDFRPGADLGTVRVDVGQVEQVVLNLFLNARDAMPAGGRITLSTENVELDEGFCHQHSWARPGSYVRLSVADTGRGMDEKTLERIFDPFFTTKERGSSTGLGLAMVQGVARQHEALLEVESEPGGGSTFRLYWPRIDRPAAVPEAAPPDEVPGSRGTVLFAEDDDVVRDMAARILEHGGYEVLTATNGEEAVRIFEERGDVDLVILDLVMPVMGGLAAREEILKSKPDARLLMASGYSGGASHRDREGIEIPLLAKPFDYSGLLKRVREMLDTVVD